MLKRLVKWIIKNKEQLKKRFSSLRWRQLSSIIVSLLVVILDNSDVLNLPLWAYLLGAGLVAGLGGEATKLLNNILVRGNNTEPKE